MQSQAGGTLSTLRDVGALVSETLGLADGALVIADDTALLGAVPEFDSMAVVAVITALEEHFGFVVEDDEISAETFETIGALRRFVESKLAG